MNIQFETATFPTVSPPNFDLKREKRKSNYLGLSAALLVFISLGLMVTSIWLAIIGFLTVAYLIAYTFKHTNKTILNFTPNGNLTIDKKGFHVDQDKKYSIPYENMKFIVYEYDRPDSQFRRFPPAKTYKLTIKLESGESLTIFPERQAKIGFRQLHGDFMETMEALRKTNHNLYKIIKNADA